MKSPTLIERAAAMAWNEGRLTRARELYLEAAAEQREPYERRACLEAVRMLEQELVPRVLKVTHVTQLSPGQFQALVEARDAEEREAQANAWMCCHDAYDR